MSKIILITGASYGIGAATAMAFAKASYDVVIHYRTSKKEAELTAESCRNFGVQAITIQADLSVQDEVDHLRAKVTEQFGSIDVLVNNAAYTDEPSFEESDSTTILHAFSQNFLTAALTIKAFVPKNINPGGCVLNVSSMYGLRYAGNPGLPIYSASKAALINLTESLAQQYAPAIRFNAVAPGYTLTPAWDGESEDRKQACIQSTLLKEWVGADEVANTLLFLASTPHINAETIVIDAGFMKKSNK